MTDEPRKEPDRERSRRPTDTIAGFLDAAAGSGEHEAGKGGPPPPAPPPPPPKTRAKAMPLLLVLERGSLRRYYFVVAKNPMSFGRERGNDVILRAFKRTGALDGAETNRISRKHLVLTMGERGVTVRDDKSNFHTTAGERGKAEQLAKKTEFALPGEFEIGFAVTSVRVRGKVLSDAQGVVEAVRVTRPDEDAAHRYILHRTRSSVGGSEADDALVVDGAPPGAAQLELGEDGEFLVRAHLSGVAVAGVALRPGDAGPLHPNEALTIGAVKLAVREFKDEDFFKPAWAK
jgi:hypothetical protein